jgi:F-type H+-transporting ATPase subunit delta
MKAAHGRAKPYAVALFSLAKERGQAEAIGQELQSVAELLARERELRDLLSRPWITAAAKRGVATGVATRLGLSPLARDFFALVAERGRAEQLDAIAGAYRDLLDADVGRVRASVRTAVRLTDDERRRLAAKLSGALGGRSVMLDERVDDTLLGGFVAESGSIIVDGSLEGQLEQLRERLVRG